MNSLRVLSTVAALALVIPLATPSFAQGRGGHGGGGAHFGGGGGAHFGGGGARMGGGGFGGGARMGGGGFAAGAAMRPSAGASFSRPAAGAAFAGASRPAFAGGNRPAAVAGNWNGGGGHWHGGGYHRRGGFWPGFAAGAAIGGLGSYAYYGGGYGAGYYDDPYYYGDSYYDEPSVAVTSDVGGGGDAAYCAQQYKSYDPASGTYLGYDGQRHPCP